MNVISFALDKYQPACILDMPFWAMWAFQTILPYVIATLLGVMSSERVLTTKKTKAE